MLERKSDRWIAITQAILLHAVVIGALAYGFYSYQKQSKPVMPTLAIEGTIVSDKDLQPVKPAAKALPEPPPPAPEPEPPPPAPPEEVGPPAPSPEEIQQREQEEKQKQEQVQRAEEERVALEKKQAEEKAAAEQKAREDAERKRQEEAKKKAEDKRKAEEAKRKADEEKVRAASEADLRKSLEAEEHLNTLRSSSAMSSWISQIANRIQRAWIRPPSARPGIDCVVHVTQVPGGAVTSVKVGECNGDAAVRQSIEDAVIRASPLPPPPDPALFERELDIRFKPQD
jgi:colicin import membrane protein